MTTIHHVFLTRFNLPSEGKESLVRAKVGWLQDRVALFERFTVPSVRQQTVASATWLVYLDVESPAWLLERIRPFAREGILTPLLRTTVPAVILRDDILEAVGGSVGDVLITSNLDNDDGLAHDFVERLVKTEHRNSRTAIYFMSGLIRTSDRLYVRRDRHNAFCSVREPLSDPMTCWADWHNLLHQSMPVHEVSGTPAWLQVVHGANVSNRVRGRIASPSLYRDGFGDLIADIPEPSVARVLQDRILDAPRRVSREAARAGAKHVIMRVAGKDGLDRVKETLTGRRGSGHGQRSTTQAS